MSIAGGVMRACAGCLYLAASVPCTADRLTVIGTFGPTESTAPYLEILQATPEDTDEPPAASPDLGAADLRRLLPIHSPNLTPGPVSTVARARPFAAPLFIIGSDLQSLRWVAAHRSALKALGAVGLLVEVPDEAALAQVLAATGDLPLIPAAGSDLAQALQLEHYPVLVTQDGVRQ